jgi:hypothetical protein
MYTYSRVPQNLGRRESQTPLSCRPERRPRTEIAGIRAWVGSGEAPQDRKHGNLGLVGGWKGIPGRESRGLGLGHRPEGYPRTGNAGILAWLTPAALGTIPDLQSAGTLIQLPGLYRAYERERSVKIFALFSHRSASQAPLHQNAVPGFCKSRRIRANSTNRKCPLYPKSNAHINH